LRHGVIISLIAHDNKNLRFNLLTTLPPPWGSNKQQELPPVSGDSHKIPNVYHKFAMQFARERLSVSVGMNVCLQVVLIFPQIIALTFAEPYSSRRISS
jgi:hypothetical protein